MSLEAKNPQTTQEEREAEIARKRLEELLKPIKRKTQRDKSTKVLEIPRPHGTGRRNPASHESDEN